MTLSNPRIQLIDTIRGIALLGILVFNIQTYALFAFLEPQQVYSLQLDRENSYAPLQFILHVLVNGQFYTIYSFLFGLGFYLLQKKNEQSGEGGNAIFKSRLWVLLLMGLLHGLIFWFGDILHKYALLGFTLIYFNRKPTKILLRWMAGIALFSAILQTLIILMSPASNLPENHEINPVILQVMNTWQTGSLAQVAGMQKLGLIMLWIMSIQSGLAGIAHYLIMFIMGLLAGRTGYFLQVPELKTRVLKIALALLPLALSLKIIAHINLLEPHFLSGLTPHFKNLTLSLSNFIAVPLLTLCYLLFSSAFLHKSNAAIFRWISNAGKMGLTNYLMQTILCMGIFYGYAGGLSGKLTLAETMLLVIPIYSFQLLFSTIWLKYNASGPVENLWRKLSNRFIPK